VTKPAAPTRECDDAGARQEIHIAMNLALKLVPVESSIVMHPVDARIRAFLSGESHGEELLHALYDHVLEEPVPEAMRALLKR
jgi:hypothetical protein